MNNFVAEFDLSAELDLADKWGPRVKIWQPYFVEGESTLSFDQAQELRDWLNLAIEKMASENARRKGRL